MVVRKLEIPPPISSGPQLDSKFLRSRDTPVLECATKRQQFSSRLFLLRAAMHACAKRTLYVSLGNRRCSSPHPRILFPFPYPSRVARFFGDDFPRTPPTEIPPRGSGKEKKGEIIESRGEAGGCLISAYKKDIPQVDSSRSVFIPDRCRISFRSTNCIIIDTSSRFFSQRSYRHPYSS